jgi:hypothetical protein
MDEQVILEDNTSLVASLHHSKIHLEASGHPDTIVEIGQQLAWVSSALCSSEFPTSVSCCTPSIERAKVTHQSDTSVSMSISLARPVPQGQQKMVSVPTAGVNFFETPP